MRKMLIAAAALMFCASPAAAQQLASHQDAAPVAAATHSAAAEPSLYPSTEQVKADVRANEARNAHSAPMGSKDWWYLVAAIAIGVIIAAVVL